MAADASASPDDTRGLDLRGRGAVVLGAGQGIGEQAAHALAQAGAKVLCVDNDSDRAAAVARAVAGVACAADATSRDDMVRVFDTARESIGRIHAVVNVIGVAFDGRVAQTDDAAWARQFEIVLRHAYLTVQIGAEQMAQAGGGAMVFVGSMAGQRVLANRSAYGAAKAGLHHWIRASAVEYAARGVRINGVAPGYVRTPRLNAMFSAAQWEAIGATVPMGRAALPADIAGPLLFLCSDLSAYVTGEIMAVDGGVALCAPPMPDLRGIA